MSAARLRKSFALWRERETRFYDNWRGYVHKRSRSPRRAYWYGRYKHAHVMRLRRERQLTRLGVTGVSSAGVALVKRFEGFRSRPYRDPVGVWTIGYGETRGVGPNTRPVTEPQAAEALRKRLNSDYFPAVRSLPTFRRLNQNQVDALTSFVYNLGPGVLEASTGIGGALRGGRFQEAANRLLDYNKAGGKVLSGLVARRQAERDLFLK